MGSNNHGKDCLTVIEILSDWSDENHALQMNHPLRNNFEIDSGKLDESKEKHKFPNSPPRHVTLCPFTGYKFSEDGSNKAETFFQDILQALDDDDHDKLESCTQEAPNQADEYCFTENGLLFAPFESSTEKEESETDTYQNETDSTVCYIKVAENLTHDALSVLEPISPPNSPL